MEFLFQFQYLFTSTILLCVVPLLMFRYLVTVYKGIKKLYLENVDKLILLTLYFRVVEAEEITTIKCKCLMRWFRKFCILSDMNRYFYPLVLYPIYLLFGK